MAKSTTGIPGNNEPSGGSDRTDTSRVLDELSRNNQARGTPQRRSGLRSFMTFIAFVVIFAPLIAAVAWLVQKELQAGAEIEELQLQARTEIEELQLQTQTEIEDLQLQARTEIEELQAQARTRIEELQLQTQTEIEALQAQDAQLETQIANVSVPAPQPQQPQRIQQAPPQINPDDFVAPQQLESELQALRSAISSRISSLSNGVSELRQRVANAPLLGDPTVQANEDWMWNEAEYLLRLANQKLQLDGDRDSALLLLNSVSTMLSRTEDPTLLSVRQTIADEVLAVRSIEQVDTSGLYVRLDSLDDLVEQLSLRAALIDNYNAQLESQRDMPAQGQDIVARTLDLISSIFVWQRWDDTSEAFLPRQQESALKQNLHLLLGQAQWALLMGEDAVYRSSLRKAADWTSTYFAIDSGTGRTLSEELGALAGFNIVEPRPDISSSLEMLRRYNDARRQNGN